ncbi:hypothetical protein K0M31_005718 [Melipona bicolor]|uniref:Uncharacterized protein n=1 Tax=Melipona bicolor TaxID=60889 RepID=A0AA40FTZ0_9HYME|nr:hypothetical protein K0M31_005718 [Melipona bicolor]
MVPGHRVEITDAIRCIFADEGCNLRWTPFIKACLTGGIGGCQQATGKNQQACNESRRSSDGWTCSGCWPATLPTGSWLEASQSSAVASLGLLSLSLSLAIGDCNQSY